MSVASWPLEAATEGRMIHMAELISTGPAKQEAEWLALHTRGARNVKNRLVVGR